MIARTESATPSPVNRVRAIILLRWLSEYGPGAANQRHGKAPYTQGE